MFFSRFSKKTYDVINKLGPIDVLEGRGRILVIPRVINGPFNFVIYSEGEREFFTPKKKIFLAPRRRFPTQNVLDVPEVTRGLVGFICLA